MKISSFESAAIKEICRNTRPTLDLLHQAASICGVTLDLPSSLKQLPNGYFWLSPLCFKLGKGVPKSIFVANTYLELRGYDKDNYDSRREKWYIFSHDETLLLSDYEKLWVEGQYDYQYSAYFLVPPGKNLSISYL